MRTKMPSLIFATAPMVAMGVSLFSFGTASAAAPAQPGCFGADRAAYIQTTLDTGAPGASEVGVILSGRAGDNGAINQAYKTTCGGDPAPGAP
jgi:hypothetical protein